MGNPPRWITGFANRVSSCMIPIDVMPPVGCHYHLFDGIWEITLFASTTEVIGGMKDGERQASPFYLNIQQANKLFDVVTAIEWQTLPACNDDELGSHVAMEGISAGHEILLRVCSHAPDRYHPGRFANVYDDRWVEIW